MKLNQKLNRPPRLSFTWIYISIEVNAWSDERREAVPSQMSQYCTIFVTEGNVTKF